MYAVLGLAWLGLAWLAYYTVCVVDGMSCLVSRQSTNYRAKLRVYTTWMYSTLTHPGYVNPPPWGNLSPPKGRKEMEAPVNGFCSSLIVATRKTRGGLTPWWQHCTVHGGGDGGGRSNGCGAWRGWREVSHNTTWPTFLPVGGDGGV